MVQTYKIVNRIDSDDPEQWFTGADSRRPTRQGDGKDWLMPVRTQHEYRRNFFSVRVIEEWNNLPDATKEAANVGQFKRLYWRHRGLVNPPMETGLILLDSLLQETVHFGAVSVFSEGLCARWSDKQGV